jgi:hypothetical protein
MYQDLTTYSAYADASSYSTEDFIGAARLFFTTTDIDIMRTAVANDRANDETFKYVNSDTGNVNLPMYITGIQFSYQDLHKLSIMHQGLFTSHYQGKKPMIIQVAGVLLEVEGLDAKRGLTQIYTDFLRISQVSRQRPYSGRRQNIAPNIAFPGVVASGAVLNLSISETSAIEGFLSFSFDFLVFAMYLKSPGNKSVHGVKTDNIIFAKEAYMKTSAVQRSKPV